MAKKPRLTNASEAIEPQGWGPMTDGLGAPVRRLLQRRKGIPTLVRMADGEEIVVHDIAWARDAGDLWEHVTANTSPPVDDRPIHFFYLSEVAAVLDPETEAILFTQEPAPGER